MGYEMRPISRQTDASRQQPGNRPPVDQNWGFRSQPRPERDYSKLRCVSCGQFGHLQSRCPLPDSSLPFKPAGSFLQSDRRQQRDGDNQTGNSPQTGTSPTPVCTFITRPPFILPVLNHHGMRHTRTLRSPLFINITSCDQK